MQLACTWTSFVFLGHSRQPAKDLSHLMFYKEQLSAANNLTPCNMSHPHWLDAHLGAPPDWPNCRVAAKAEKRARLQHLIPRETKYHRCMFMKGGHHLKSQSLVISFLFYDFLCCLQPQLCCLLSINTRFGNKLGKPGIAGKCSDRPKTGLISTL